MSEIQNLASTPTKMPAGPRTLLARFETNGTGYHYFIPPGDNPQPGDLIVTSQVWGYVNRPKRAAIEMTKRGRPMPPTKPLTIEAVNFLDGEEEEVDDMALSSQRLRNSIAFAETMKIAVVVSLQDITSPKANRYYMHLLSSSELEARTRAMEDIIQQTIRQTEARERLLEIVKEQAEVDLFRKVATTNEEAQRLLKILEGND